MQAKSLIGCAPKLYLCSLSASLQPLASTIRPITYRATVPLEELHPPFHSATLRIPIEVIKLSSPGTADLFVSEEMKTYLCKRSHLAK
jgi:hypothetical protein